jgi:hypothetical protein
MRLTKSEVDFIKRNKEVLEGLFSRRIEELKEHMVVAEDKNRVADLIIELKYWLQDIKIFTKTRKKKKVNYI